MAMSCANAFIKKTQGEGTIKAIGSNEQLGKCAGLACFFFPSSPFLSSIHSEALILKMMLFFPTSCLSNEVLISGLQLSSQQGEDEVRRSWEKWRAREQCGGNNAHLCSSGLLGNGGCIQLPGKITCPKKLGRDAHRKEVPCSREGGECYPDQSGAPPMDVKCLPLIPV